MWRVLAMLGVVLGVATLTVIGIRFAAATLVRKAMTGGFHTTAAQCPKCGRGVKLSWGKDARCPGCGERLAACAQCGEVLAGAGITHRERSTAGGWLCATHYEAQEWEAARLREFDSPETKGSPPETPEARAARRLCEEKIRKAYQAGKDVRASLFADAERSAVDVKSLPPSVREAYSFYVLLPVLVKPSRTSATTSTSTSPMATCRQRNGSVTPAHPLAGGVPATRGRGAPERASQLRSCGSAAPAGRERRSGHATSPRRCRS